MVTHPLGIRDIPISDRQCQQSGYIWCLTHRPTSAPRSEAHQHRIIGHRRQQHKAHIQSSPKAVSRLADTRRPSSLLSRFATSGIKQAGFNESGFANEKRVRTFTHHDFFERSPSCQHELHFCIKLSNKKQVSQRHQISKTTRTPSRPPGSHPHP